jgi:hypothetical protein
MTNEDKTLFGLLITFGIGFYLLSKVNKKSGFGSEKEELIKQDCFNAAKEAKIPDEKTGEFIADCMTSIKLEEA